VPKLFAPLAVSATVFFCTFAAAVFSTVLRKKLPDDHLSEDSKDVIKLVMGLIATMAALILGLLLRTAPTRRKAVNCSRFRRSSSSSTAFWRNMGRRQTIRGIGSV
jgi:hypothetical protein